MAENEPGQYVDGYDEARDDDRRAWSLQRDAQLQQLLPTHRGPQQQQQAAAQRERWQAAFQRISTSLTWLLDSGPSSVAETRAPGVVFVFLLGLWFLWQHATECFVWLSLSIISNKSNEKVVQGCAVSGCRASILSMLIVVATGVTVTVFSSGRSIIPTHIESDASIGALAQTVYHLVVTDHLCRLVVICIKAAVLLVHQQLYINLKHGSRIFLIIELAAQLTRMLLPIPVWMAFFYTATAKDGKQQEPLFSSFSAFVSHVGHSIWNFNPRFDLIYLACKLLMMAVFVRQNRGALHTSIVPFGEVVPQERAVEMAAVCPICHAEAEEMDTPVALPCSHTFCCDCLGRWLENKDTCPVCRATVKDTGRRHVGHTSMVDMWV